jgi:L-ribulose-5-phosphate 4-epimerase
MGFEALRKQALEANQELQRAGMGGLGRGSVAIVDREAGVLALPPSGMLPSAVTADDILVLGLVDFAVREGGGWGPDGMVHTHIFIANVFLRVGAVVTFSTPHVAAFAIANRDLPPYCAAHAEHFLGAVPCARAQTPNEVAAEFEATLGLTVLDTFEARGLDYESVPGALLPGYGAVCWGRDVVEALSNACALEESAHAAFLARQLDAGVTPMARDLVEAHYRRARSLAGE